jgi:hypothetical protein
MDEAALNSARSVQKVDPFPPGLGTDVYRPKIKFQLE